MLWGVLIYGEWINCLLGACSFKFRLKRSLIKSLNRKRMEITQFHIISLFSSYGLSDLPFVYHHSYRYIHTRTHISCTLPFFEVKFLGGKFNSFLCLSNPSSSPILWISRQKALYRVLFED